MSKTQSKNQNQVKNETQSDEEKFIVVFPSELDIEDIEIGVPTTKTFVLGNGTIQTCTSEITHTSGKKILIALPTATTFGITEMFEMGEDSKKKTPEEEEVKKVKGYQFNYPLQDTVKTETNTYAKAPANPEQQAVIDLFDKLRLKAAVEGKHYVELQKKENQAYKKALVKKSKGGDPPEKKSLIPEGAFNGLFSASQQDEEDHSCLDGVKPMYNYPKIKDKTGKTTSAPDESKPPSAYIPLVVRKSRANKDKKDESIQISIESKFYVEGEDEPVNPKNFLGKRGKITPLFRLDSLYWGTHGSSPYGLSIKGSCVQADFEEIQSVPSLPIGRMIPRPFASQKSSDDDEVIDKKPVKTSKRTPKVEEDLENSEEEKPKKKKKAPKPAKVDSDEE